MTPSCELPSGVLRQWHVFEDGICACGARETRLTPVSLPAPRAKPANLPPDYSIHSRRAKPEPTPEPAPEPAPEPPQVERRAPEPRQDPGIECPTCHKVTESEVIDSRQQPGRIKRRRVCLLCKDRFTTYERAGTEEDDRRKGR